MTPIPLARMDRNSRILVTAFLLTMLVAFFVAGLNIYDKVGRAHASIVQRYGPDMSSSGQHESGSEVSSQDLSALPGENDAIVARSNTFSALVDVTHAHAFELPLILFVLAHFLMRTRVPDWVKLTNYCLSMAGVVLFLAAPWLVRYVSIRTAFLFDVGAVAILGTAVFMTVYSIWDMWRPAGEAEAL